MSRIAFVTWHGGGNLGPALAIARELQRRGHRAAFLMPELSSKIPTVTGTSRRVLPALTTSTA